MSLLEIAVVGWFAVIVAAGFAVFGLGGRDLR